MKNKRNVSICGDQCPDCTYIGGGDYMRDKFDEPVIVLTEFSYPTEDYMKCKRGRKFKDD